MAILEGDPRCMIIQLTLLAVLAIAVLFVASIVLYRVAEWLLSDSDYNDFSQWTKRTCAPEEPSRSKTKKED